MLEIRAIMNSSMEDVLAFKTCCGQNLFDQNLEIHLTNRGDRPIYVQSRMDLVGTYGSKRVTTLTPPRALCIEPGQIVAFYCFMDEELWKESRSMTFYDLDQRAYTLALA
jgi:hypothetical protein